MPNPRIDPAKRDQIILEAVRALEHGVTPRTIAERHGIHYATLARWLRYNLDAYRARHLFINGYLAHLHGKRRDWHLRMRLERLSLYRQLHGMPPNPPQPRKNKRGDSIATPAIESSTQAIDCKDNPSGKGAELPPNMPPGDAV